MQGHPDMELDAPGPNADPQGSGPLTPAEIQRLQAQVSAYEMPFNPAAGLFVESLPLLSPAQVFQTMAKAYSDINPRLEADGSLVKYSVEMLPEPLPSYNYTENINAAEDMMMSLYQYLITYQFKTAQMPNQFLILMSRIQGNIANLGGSFKLRIPDIQGKIPPDPATLQPGMLEIEEFIPQPAEPSVSEVPPPSPPDLQVRVVDKPTFDSGTPLVPPTLVDIQPSVSEVLQPKEQKSFSKPPYLDEVWVKDMKKYPGVIRVDVGLIFTYLKLVRGYTPGQVFPPQFLNFVKDNSLKESLSSFVSHEATLPGQTEVQLQNKVIELFTRLIHEDARDPELLARESFLRGSIVQGTLNVFRYIETFKSQARHLPDMLQPITQKWLCSSFKDGLIPELRAACVVDTHGKEWNILQDLMDMAIIEESRILAKQRANPSFSSAYPAVKRASLNSAQGVPPGKRHKTAADYLPISQMPREYLTAPMSRPLRERMMKYNACWWCRDEQHFFEGTPCPFAHLPRPKDGDFSPKYPPPQQTFQTPIQAAYQAPVQANAYQQPPPFQQPARPIRSQQSRGGRQFRGGRPPSRGAISLAVAYPNATVNHDGTVNWSGDLSSPPPPTSRKTSKKYPSN